MKKNDIYGKIAVWGCILIWSVGALLGFMALKQSTENQTRVEMLQGFHFEAEKK